MTHILKNEHSYLRLLDGSGNAITSSGGMLDVGATFAGDVTSATHNNFNCNANLQISDVDLAFGQGLMTASLPVCIASDQSSLTVDSLQLPAALGQQTAPNSFSVVQDSAGNWSVRNTTLEGKIDTLDTAVDGMSAKLPSAIGQQTDLLSLSVVQDSTGDWTVRNTTLEGKIDTLDTAVDGMSAKLPAALGPTTGVNSLSVVPASDASFTVSATDLDIRNLTNADVVGAEVSIMPVAGAHANASSAVTTAGPNENSSAVDCQYVSKLVAFGSVDQACTSPSFAPKITATITIPVLTLYSQALAISTSVSQMPELVITVSSTAQPGPRSLLPLLVRPKHFSVNRLNP